MRQYFRNSSFTAMSQSKSPGRPPGKRKRSKTSGINDGQPSPSNLLLDRRSSPFLWPFSADQPVVDDFVQGSSFVLREFVDYCNPVLLPPSKNPANARSSIVSDEVKEFLRNVITKAKAASERSGSTRERIWKDVIKMPVATILSTLDAELRELHTSTGVEFIRGSLSLASGKCIEASGSTETIFWNAERAAAAFRSDVVPLVLETLASLAPLTFLVLSFLSSKKNRRKELLKKAVDE